MLDRSNPPGLNAIEESDSCLASPTVGEHQWSTIPAGLSEVVLSSIQKTAPINYEYFYIGVPNCIGLVVRCTLRAVLLHTTFASPVDET